MATNFLSLRSSAAPSISAVNLTISTLTGSAIATSTITVSTLNIQSTTISLGQSTNQTYNNFSNGSYLTWATPKSDMTSANKTVQSANGLYQMLVANATSGLFLSSDSGITWSTLSGGLPTLTGSAYWSDGAISANGQYITLSIYGGSLWMSADYGRTFALTNQPTPNIWLPLNGNTTDSMGLSVVTATGSPGYVTLNYPGYTAQAVNLANTAGGTATRYIRGTWTGASNFTVSFWFNVQTLGVQQQALFVAYAGNYVIALNASNQITWYIPSGGSGLIAVTGPVVSINTWYYVSAIFQTNGTCSLYVNNSLAGTYTNLGGVGSYTTTAFAIGTYDTSTPSAFNGYIDDLRITNSVSTYVPIPHLQPNIWMPFENSTADLGSNAITSTVTGSLSYVPGIIGLNAVNIANTPGGAATNFIQGNISVSGINVITVSAWFNAQSFPLTGASVIIGIGGISIGTYVGIYLSTTGSLIFYFLNSSSVAIIIGSVPSISLNTWYHVYLIFQQTGTCIAYLNSTLIGSVAGSALFGSNLIYDYTLGRNVANNDVAFNGYVDDFRVYNAAIPIHVLFPQNYRSLALSGTGQYALAAATSGWVVGSSDSSQTWSRQAVNVGTQVPATPLVYVGTQGSTIQPNKASLTQNSWEQNGVNWASSVSSVLSGIYAAYFVFNGTDSGDNWSSAQTYTNGAYTGSVSTTVIGIGAVNGEWLQIQSSIPLVIQSYRYSCAVNSHTMSKYYIVGSTDATNWFPIQYVVFSSNPFTAWNQAITTSITVNSTGTQSVTAGSTVNLTSTAYASSSTNVYNYFRIIGTEVFAGGSYNQFSEFYPTFMRPSSISRPPTHTLSLNHTGQYQLVATGPVAGSIMPNQTGIAASTWSQGGINWQASASSVLSVLFPYGAFNNFVGITGTYSWCCANSLYGGTSAAYNGSRSTSILGLSPVLGEWLQLQSSVPLVMTSYTYASGGQAGNNPRIYHIVGSNDGSTWYPIQSAVMTTNPSTTQAQTCTTYITVNQSGTQTIQGGQTGSGTFTTYSTTTNAYTHFRIIATAIYTLGGNYEFNEFYPIFRNSVSYSSNYGSTWLNTSSTVSNESVALSASGQYVLSTNSVTPFARLTLDNTNVDAQGVLVPATGAGTPGYSTSIKAVGTHSAFFNNTAGAVATIFLNYTIPAALTSPSMLTQACWVYPTAHTGSAPRVWFMSLGNNDNGSLLGMETGGILQHFTVNNSTFTQTGVVAPLNTWSHVAMTFSRGLITIYVNGVARNTSTISGNLYTVATQLVIGTSSTTTDTRAFQGYIDDARIYTSALNADEINGLFRNPALTQTVAVSNSYLPITSYIEPVLPLIAANVVDAAVSQTGQYMVAVTSSTTNNVYYSTDFGTTFTALTIGTAAMVSCSISYDGSYLTVESATTVHTLNRNTRGFSVAVGNQAGLVNQAQNAIAIGDKAGRTNQSANSIVLNATGNALDAVAPGFYVAPVATAGSSSAAPFNLLGYGTDNQIVQSSALTVLQNGNVGIGTANSTTPLTIYSSGFGTAYLSIYGPGTAGNTSGINISPWSAALRPGGTSTTMWALDDGDYSAHLLFGTAAPGAPGSTTVTERMRITSSGNVGIGTTAPQGHLHAYSSSGWSLIRATTSSTSWASALLIDPAGTVSPSTPSWFIGERDNAHGPLSIWAFNGTVHQNNVVTISATGNVGIGITNPAQPLDVSGSIARNGLKLPRFDYGTVGAATTVSIPILFSDTQYNMVEIRFRYVVSAITDVNMSATSTTSVAMNLSEVGLTIVKYNSPSAPSYYSNVSTTSFIFASTVEQVGIDNNLVFRIVRATGTSTIGIRNHYSFDNVYCWSGVGTSRGYGQGHIDTAGVGGPALAFLNFSCVSGNINGSWSTTHYN